MMKITRPVVKRYIATGLLGTALLLGVTAPSLGQIRVAQRESSEVGAIEPFTIQGVLDANSEVLEQGGSFYTPHTFAGQAGQRVTIEMVGTDFDAYLLLYSPDGNLISENDDGAGGTNARIVIELPITGSYTILATAYNAGATGQYTLTMQPTSAEEVARFEALSEAEQLNQQVFQLYQQGRYTEAIPFAQRSLEIQEEVLGDDHPDVATSLNNLAELYRNQGNYATAEPLFRRAISIRETVLGENHPDVAQILNNLALLYLEQGNYAAAEPLFRRAISIRETVLGENHPLIAINLNNLAVLYQNQGNYAAAEPLFLRSLSILETALGENHLNVATSLNNLASFYLEQDNYAAAEPLYLRSLSILETALGENHPDVAQSLNNLALLYLEQGNYTTAEPLFRQAISIHETALGENHPDVAQSLNNLALLYQDQGNYTAAEPLFRQALSIHETALGENHPNVATSLSNLASLYQDQGNYAAAEPLYLRSLSIRKATLGENHPDVALSLNNLAVLYQDQGNYAAAEPLFQQALSIFETTLGEYHLKIATSLINLADLYLAQENIPQAIEALQAGLAVEETNLALTLSIGSESRKQAYINTMSGTTNGVFSFHLQAADANLDAARLALTTTFRRKGRILDTVTRSFQRLRQNLSPEEMELFNQYTSIQSQLVALLYGGLDDQNLSTYRTQVETLQQESDRLENELARLSAEFRVETAPVEIETVQAMIPADTVLVELVRYRPFNPRAMLSEHWGDSRYAAYTLTSSGTIQWADLGDAEAIDQAVDQLLIHLQNPNQLQAAQQAARSLDALVMQPIRGLVGDATHLLLSPDGQLNLIPFAALMDENGQYLVENYQITYLTSGRDLLKLQLDAPSRQSPVILANPNFDTPGNPNPITIATANTAPARNTPTEVITASSTEDPDTRADRRSTDLASLQFDPLPGTEREATAIAALLPTTTLLTDRNATENTLKQLQAPSILHIATHGFFLEDVQFLPPSDPNNRGITIDYFENPNSERGDRPINNENPLLRSGLALAGFNPRQSGTEDGVLTALEASNLDLYGTELVVLSACETGVGSVANGEGVYGLRRAFLMAGAESLMMSLWQVSDQGTADLMTHYYQRLLNGEGRSTALRNTQLELMQTPDYKHPYYWASFIVSGDWRPLSR